MDEVAVLLPCYNEAQTIGKVVRDFRDKLPEAIVYVYDNNSSDGTAQQAAEAGAVVRREREQGKGNVIRRMFREIEARCYIIADGDDTYPPENAPEMARLVLEEQVDMVVGDRLSTTYFTENKRRFHNAGNLLVRKSVNSLFDSKIKDIMTGYRAFSYLFVKSFPVLSGGFQIETEMSIHAVDKRMRVESVSVGYRDRPEGSESKLNTLSDGFSVLHMILRMFRMFRPFAFFSWLAGILLLITLVLFVPIAGEFLRTGLVPRFPTLIGCVFLGLAAVQSFFAGLILDAIRQKNLQDFEIKLLELQRQLP